MAARRADAPDQGWAIGVHRHATNRGTPADETTTGLDHFALAVSSREDLDAWARWLNEQGIQHQLESFHLNG